jgi:hypothetical protein
MASRQNASNSNNNNNGSNSNSRFAILSLVDNSDSDDNVQGDNTQGENFEVTINVESGLSRSQSDNFLDLERGLSRLIFDDEDCVFVDGEETPSSPRPEKLGGGGEIEEEENEEDEGNVEVEPLHLHLRIPGFRDDDRSGTLGTISWVLANLKHSGIHPFPGRTYIKLPTIDQLVAEGYDHKVTETFRPDLALMNSKAIGTMCKWIYDENAAAMANLTVKVNVQTLDMAVEFIFQKKTDKPHATVHGGSTQAGVDEVVAQVVAKHLAENPNAFGGGGGGGAPKASFKEAALRDPVRESNTPKVSALKEPAPLKESAPKATKIGGSARPAPPRCESWATAETILADLALAVPHQEGMVASATYTLEEGTPEEFATWCMSATGKKSIEISAKKDGKRRVRVFAGDKPGHVKKAPVGGGSASSKR